MSLVKLSVLAAFALLSSQACAHPHARESSHRTDVQQSFEAFAGDQDEKVVMTSPTERRVNGVREVLVWHEWMIAPN